MKKILSIVVLAAVSLTASAQIGFDYGVLAGLNMNKVTLNKQYRDNFNPSNRTGFYFGPKINISILGIGADAAVVYSQRVVNLDKDKDKTLKSFEIPVNFRYSVGLGSIASVYAATGPQFGFNIGNKKWSLTEAGAVKKNFTSQNSTLSWNVGCGVKLLKHFEAGLLYNIGLSKYAKLYKLAGGSGSTAKKFSSRANSFQMQVAYLF